VKDTVKKLNKLIIQVGISLLIIAAFFLCGLVIWKNVFIDERICSVNIGESLQESVSEIYNIKLDKGKLSVWKKYEYRDNHSFYILEISGCSFDEFSENNKGIVSKFISVNSCRLSDIKKRESVCPYIFYDDRSIKIVTTDLEHNKLSDEYEFEQLYSDSIAEAFVGVYDETAH